MPPTDVIRVAIVEDDRATREGLAMLIDGTPTYCCAGAFASVEEALEQMSRRPADILLLDVHLPGISGPDGVRLIRELAPAVQILMLTVFSSGPAAGSDSGSTRRWRAHVAGSRAQGRVALPEDWSAG
jgi:DNA-binding NarL/FixJ family response regulator